MAVGNVDGVVHLIDAQKSEIIGSPKNHGMPVRALAFTCSSHAVISAGEDLHIFVTDCETLQRKYTMVGHTKQITCIESHPLNEDIFATASLDGIVMIWNMQEASKPTQTVVLGQPIWSLAFSPNGEHFVAVSEPGTLTLVKCSKD